MRTLKKLIKDTVEGNDYIQYNKSPGHCDENDVHDVICTVTQKEYDKHYDKLFKEIYTKINKNKKPK